VRRPPLHLLRKSLKSFFLFFSSTLANSKEELPIAFFRGGPRIPPTKNSPINEYILRFKGVRLISSTGEQLGVLEPQAALAKGREEGLDVVVIAEQADPPVCKIMDYGKFTFEKKKKEHESKKKQKVTQVKEIKFRPNIDEHDYDFKFRNIVRFLEEGDKVKATVQFRGREMSRLDNGRKVLDRLIKDLEGKAHAESGTEMMGNRMHQILSPIKKH
jgi:translation initiation factor IF-3